jgi:hypothetical protein
MPRHLRLARRAARTARQELEDLGDADHPQPRHRGGHLRGPREGLPEAPERYAELGVNELILFDPDFQQDEDRLRWQRYRKLRRGFALVDVTNADRIRSRVLGCFLRVIGDGDHVRLRLGTGPTGDVLVPTAVEIERAALQRVAGLTALLAQRDEIKG